MEKIFLTSIVIFFQFFTLALLLLIIFGFSSREMQPDSVYQMVNGTGRQRVIVPGQITLNVITLHLLLY